MLSQIIHGDNMKVLPALAEQGVQARLLLTDPPYGGIIQDGWDTPGALTDQLCELMRKCLTPDASIYVWCGLGEKSKSLLDFYPILARHFHFKDIITWKKRRGLGTRRGWLYTREELLWFVVDPKNFVWNKEHQYSDEPNAFKVGMSGTAVNPTKRITNVWIDIPERLVRDSNQHPCTKPLEALERVILAHTEGPQDIVLDPFAGGGSTIVAATRLRRGGIGIERDAHWASVATEALCSEEESEDW